MCCDRRRAGVKAFGGFHQAGNFGRLAASLGWRLATPLSDLQQMGSFPSVAIMVWLAMLPAGPVPSRRGACSLPGGWQFQAGAAKPSGETGLKALATLIGWLPAAARREPLRTVRQPLHAAGFPVVLLFSQKAGCSSLVKWFFFQIGKLDEAMSYNNWIHRYRTEVFLRQPGYQSQTAQLLDSRERPVIKLVRNPYDRAVSSFLHTVRGAGRKKEPGWEMAILRAARERAGKPVGNRPRLSFRDFMRHLAANGTAFEQINGHVAQQYLPVEDGLVARIIRLESFDADIRQVETDYGLKASPLELITTSRHHLNVDKAARGSGACAADQDIAYRHIRDEALPAYAAMYDAETTELVRTCFGDDFDKYGYPDAVPGRNGI